MSKETLSKEEKRSSSYNLEVIFLLQELQMLAAAMVKLSIYKHKVFFFVARGRLLKMSRGINN